MPTIVQTTVYLFDELSESAKEKAREWYREGALDHEWWDAVYEDAVQCGAVLGIEIANRAQRYVNVTTHASGTYRRPAIYFSGFWPQGDGACFEGSYEWKAGCRKAIRQHAPQDKELHRIADDLYALQRPNFYRLTARMAQRGHYNHSGCMVVDVSGNDTRQEGWAHIEETLTQLMRDFSDWIYAQLEKESEWLMANEQVDDSIRANEYTFTEDGGRA